MNNWARAVLQRKMGYNVVFNMCRAGRDAGCSVAAVTTDSYTPHFSNLNLHKSYNPRHHFPSISQLCPTSCCCST